MTTRTINTSTALLPRTRYAAAATAVLYQQIVRCCRLLLLLFSVRSHMIVHPAAVPPSLDTRYNDENTHGLFKRKRTAVKQAFYQCVQQHHLLPPPAPPHLPPRPHLLVRVPSVDLEVLYVFPRRRRWCWCRCCCRRFAPYGRVACQTCGRRPSCPGRARRYKHHFSLSPLSLRSAPSFSSLSSVSLPRLLSESETWVGCFSASSRSCCNPNQKNRRKDEQKRNGAMRSIGRNISILVRHGKREQQSETPTRCPNESHTRTDGAILTPHTYSVALWCSFGCSLPLRSQLGDRRQP